MEKTSYVRCPRCELNYIKQGEQYCSVCQAELSLEKEEDFDELDLDLCPVCKVNYIKPDEVMCSSCLKERELEDGTLPEDVEVPNNDEWNNYVNRDEEEFVSDDEETGEMASITELDETDLALDDEDLATIPDGIDFDDEDSEEDEEDEEDEDDEDDKDDDDFDDDLDDDDDFDDDDEDDGDKDEDDDF